MAIFVKYQPFSIIRLFPYKRDFYPSLPYSNLEFLNTLYILIQKLQFEINNASRAVSIFSSFHFPTHI